MTTACASVAGAVVQSLPNPSRCDSIGLFLQFKDHGPALRDENECLTIRKVHDVTDRPPTEINPVDPFCKFSCETHQHRSTPPQEDAAPAAVRASRRLANAFRKFQQNSHMHAMCQETTQ